MPLPTFQYHPDPVATGHVEASDAHCACCGEARGWVYTGPVYAEEELDEALCPWCIANGAAHAQFDATFTDEAGIGGYGNWAPVAAEVVAEVAQRTPGFSGWQQERWWTHCGDAAAFIGRMGRAELNALGSEALAAVQADAGLADGSEWPRFLAALNRDGSPTAYLFRCLHCGVLGGYQDAA